jgi:preprotein translocase subunit SecG
METILVILFVIVALLLNLVIVLQPGKGSGMGAIGGGGGSGSVFGARGAIDFLTKVTAWLAAAFMILSLVLARLSLDTTAVTATTINPALLKENPDEIVPERPVADENTGEFKKEDTGKLPGEIKKKEKPEIIPDKAIPGPGVGVFEKPTNQESQEPGSGDGKAPEGGGAENSGAQ